MLANSQENTNMNDSKKQINLRLDSKLIAKIKYLKKLYGNQIFEILLSTAIDNEFKRIEKVLPSMNNSQLSKDFKEIKDDEPQK